MRSDAVTALRQQPQEQSKPDRSRPYIPLDTFCAESARETQKIPSQLRTAAHNPDSVLDTQGPRCRQ
jgi:hypothetical protein